MGQSKTSKYYASNPEARRKRLKYQKEYNAKSENVKKRTEDNAARKKLGLKKGDPRDASRTKGGGFVAEDKKTNRARQGANGKSTKK